MRSRGHFVRRTRAKNSGASTMPRDGATAASLRIDLATVSGRPL